MNREDYGFIVIDKTQEMKQGRYKFGFYTFIIVFGIILLVITSFV